MPETQHYNTHSPRHASALQVCHQCKRGPILEPYAHARNRIVNKGFSDFMQVCIVYIVSYTHCHDLVLCLALFQGPLTIW